MSSIYWWLFQYLSHKAVKILFGLDYFPWHKILFIYILVSEQSQDFIFVVARFSSDFKKLSLWPRPPPLLNDPCHWPELPECGTKGILKRPPLSFNSRVVPHGTWIPFMSSNIFLNVTFNSSLLKKCPKLMTLELILLFFCDAFKRHTYSLELGELKEFSGAGCYRKRGKCNPQPSLPFIFKRGL